MLNKIYNFDIKKKIILKGESDVFNNWKKFVPSLKAEDFIEALEWVCDDPRDEFNRPLRAMGLMSSGEVVRLKYGYNSDDFDAVVTLYSADTGFSWGGDIFPIPCDDPRFADKDGMWRTNYKIAINATDRV